MGDLEKWKILVGDLIDMSLRTAQIFGPGFNPFGVAPLPVPEAVKPYAPELVECTPGEAVDVLLSDKYWSESVQGKIDKMAKAGYVIARRVS